MKFLMWFGMSQTGKSSSIKLLTNDMTIKCGQYGAGSSTTSEVKVYKDLKPKMSTVYHHIDSIGLGDNRLLYNDKEILNHIEMEILKIAQNSNVDSVSAIIVTESLKGDVLHLKPIFQQIKNILGYFPSNSIVVLGTKKNDCNNVFAEKKKVKIMEVLAEFGVPSNKYLQFGTPCHEIQFYENQINSGQYAQLETRINQCPPIKLNSITEKQKMIQTKTLQKVDQLTVTETIMVEQDKVQYKTQQRSKVIQVAYEKRAGGLRGVFGGTNTRYRDQTINWTEQVPYTVKIKVPRQVKKPPPYDYCYRLVMEEFQKQFSAPLSQPKN